MRHRHHFILGFILLIVLLLAGPFWYRGHYAMKPAHSMEVGPAAATQRVLIATQGSPFKDLLLERLLAHLQARGVFVRVMDVSGLSAVDDKSWSAIVLIHTWEYWRPQPDAKAFAARVQDPKKLIVVTTSGSGDEKLPGIDVISAASDVREAGTTVSDVTRRLDALLAAAG